MMTIQGFQGMLLAVWSCWVVYLHADLHIHILPESCSYLNSHMPVETREVTKHPEEIKPQSDPHFRNAKKAEESEPAEAALSF